MPAALTAAGGERRPLLPITAFHSPCPPPACFLHAVALSTAQTSDHRSGRDSCLCLLCLLSGGAQEARYRRRSTVVGLAAFGGGTLHDILLFRRTFFWVEHSSWLWAVLGLSLLSMLLLRGRHFEPTERAILWPDALGLGLFTAGGTSSRWLPPCRTSSPCSWADHRRLRRRAATSSATKSRAPSRPSPYAVCAFIGGWCVVFADRPAPPTGSACLPARQRRSPSAPWPSCSTGACPGWRID